MQYHVVIGLLNIHSLEQLRAAALGGSRYDR